MFASASANYLWVMTLYFLNSCYSFPYIAYWSWMLLCFMWMFRNWNMMTNLHIKRLPFVAMLGFLMKVTIATDHRSHRKDLTTATCHNLDNDGTQYNAYGYPEFGDSFCCDCPRGTYFVGDCDLANPRSTKCLPCPFNSHVDFEPHLQVQCSRKYWRPCPSPKVYSRGSRAEADGCVCPNGMIQDDRTKYCMLKASSKSKAIVPKRLTTITTTTSNTISSTPRTDGTSARLITGSNSFSTEDSSPFVEPDKASTADVISGGHNKENAHTLKVTNASSLIVCFVVLSVMFSLLLVIAVASKLYKRHKGWKSESLKSSCTDITDNSASTSLIRVEEGQQPHRAENDSTRVQAECRFDCVSDKRIPLMEASHDKIPSDNRQSLLMSKRPLRLEDLNTPRRKTITATHPHQEEPSNSKTSDLIMKEKTDNQPVQHRTGHIFHDPAPMVLGSYQHAVLPTDECQSTSILSEHEEQDRQKIAIMEQRARQIAPARHENFAMDVAMKFETELAIKEVPRIFRHVLRPLTQEDDNRICEIMENPRLTNPDRINKLMRYACMRKGAELTPCHLLTTIDILDYKRYTKIVIEVIRQYSSQKSEVVSSDATY